jgi:ABC-2 type transport system permease protein
MNLSKISVVASREYLAVVRSKAFVISLVLLPLMVFGSIAIQKATNKVKDLHDRYFGVVDRTPGEVLYPKLQADVDIRNARVVVDGKQTEPYYRLRKFTPAADGEATDQQRLALSQMVREGSLAAFIDIGAGVLSPSKGKAALDRDVVRYQTNNPTYNEFRQISAESINRAVQARRIADLKLDPKVVAGVIATVPVVPKGLAEAGEDGKIGYSAQTGELASFMVPFALAMLMFVVVMVGAVPLLQGVIEEKQQRIAEVLLGSVRPFDLMAGKVLGLVGTSATLIVLYMAGAFWGLSHEGLLELVPMHILPWFVVFEVLSVLMYGSLYIAIGASVNEPKELQSLLLPLNLIGVLPILILSSVMQNPNGPIAVAGTWFPLSSPIVTVTRMAVPPGIPAMEALGAMGMVIVATVVLVWAAGRIFRVGILMQGKPPKIADLVKWVVRG